MNTRIAAIVNTFALGAAIVLGLPNSSPSALAQGTPAGTNAPAAATEDILHMADGRVLRGQVISKTKTHVIFEYVDAKVNIKTRLTLAVENILKMEEDVAAGAAPTAPAAASPTATPTSGSPLKLADKSKPAEDRRTYGASRVQTEDPNVPSIYIVPMKGQMGTDINKQVYEKVRDDILAKKPSIVVIEMFSQDTEDMLYPEKGQEEQGLLDLDEFRKMVNIFQDDLSQFRQVCWVHDSLGISSTVAMTWDELYMKPSARLGGMVVAMQMGFENWQDDDVRGKMTAAFMAWIKGFLESGHYALELAEAMVRPRFMLSATWKGREVQWTLDDTGEYVVDSNDKKTTEFRAKDAEDLCVSDGTAETLEDLALLLGLREFRVLDSDAERLCTNYVEDWRRSFEKCKTQLEDYRQFLGWANGEDAVKYLGRAKAALEDILAACQRYTAVDIRVRRDLRITQQWLTIQIELIKEQLRGLKDRSPAGGGGGSGGGSFGGGRRP